MEIKDAVKQLQSIVTQLRGQYEAYGKHFTLDGRLVGDLGEVLVAQEYDVALYDYVAPHHDGETSDGRKVQIKATMKDALTFPCRHIPDYYIGIRIDAEGCMHEIFNGPGAVAHQAVANRKVTRTNLHSISISALQRLNETVEPADRIPRRALR